MEIKPCPFCGGEGARSYSISLGGIKHHMIECFECSSTGPNFTHEGTEVAISRAIQAWNNRTANSGRG